MSRDNDHSSWLVPHVCYDSHWLREYRCISIHDVTTGTLFILPYSRSHSLFIHINNTSLLLLRESRISPRSVHTYSQMPYLPPLLVGG